MQKKEELTDKRLADRNKLLKTIRDHVDGAKGYFPTLQASTVLLNFKDYADPLLLELIELDYIRLAYGKVAVEITDKGREFLNSLEVNRAKNSSENSIDKPGLWNRFSGWALVNILLRFYKYKE